MSFDRTVVQNVADKIRADRESRTYSCEISIPAAILSDGMFQKLHREAEELGFKRPVFASALLEVAKSLANGVSVTWNRPTKTAARGFGLKVTPALNEVLVRAAKGRFSRDRLIVAILQRALDELD